MTNATAQTVGLQGLLDSLFRPFTGRDVPGASVMAIREGKVLVSAAYGMAEIGKGIPATTATNYRLASVTKQFTAASVMILEERGLLSYDQTLKEFFPSIPRHGERITIRHLLGHTSGLVDYEECMADTATVQVLDRDVLRLIERVDSTYFPPGTAFKYSNTAYALLALIVEKVSGMPFARFLKENIFRPVGMTQTVAYERGISEVSNRAFGYVPIDSTVPGFVQRDQSSTSAVLGDGGMYSSVEDLRKWVAELEDPRIISRATLQEAWTGNVLPSGEKTGYGFGWYVDAFHGIRRVHHSGSTISFRTHLMIFPDVRVAVIVLMNRSNGDPGGIAARIAEHVLGTGR